MSILHACPLCSSRVGVIDTHVVPSATTIRRQRRCNNVECGYRLTTYEITKEKYIRLQTLSGLASQIAASVSIILEQAK